MLHLRQGTSGHESTPPHEPALLRSQNARRAQVPGWFEKRMQLVCRRRQLSTGQPNLHVSAPLSATCSLTHHQPLGHVQSTARSPSWTEPAASAGGSSSRREGSRQGLRTRGWAANPHPTRDGQVPRETDTDHARAGAQSGGLARPLASNPGAPQELWAFPGDPEPTSLSDL